MRVQAGRPIACVAAEAIPGSTGQTNDAGKPILARSSSYMIHLDVKKVGRIPPKGGWRAHGRGTPEAKASKRGKSTRIGYTYLHTAIDGFSRLAYTEALDERASTTIGFFCRARAFFAAHGITRLVRVVTDNGANYRARTFTTTITSLASRHQRTRPDTHVTTARSSATTASWPRSASTRVPTPQSSSAAMPSRCEATTTTTIDPTPPAATSLLPPASQHTSPTS